jgi:hypothetical protein
MMAFTLIMLGSGLFWTVTYILIIRRGMLDRTYGMPLVALCANISWEFIYSFVLPSDGIQRIVNIIWFALDTVIVWLFLRYGPKEFADLSKRTFYTLAIVTLITSFCAVLFAGLTFHDHGTYSAFGQNLLMSAAFIAMLYRRKALRGQSISIAVCKLIGTACASLAFYLYSTLSQHSILLQFCYIAIFVYDIVYVVMIYMQQKQQKIQRGQLI